MGLDTDQRKEVMLLSPKSMHAFKWSLFGEAASRLIAPVTFLALAFLLTPSDFGVVAAATVVISLTLALSEAGFGKALVQRRDGFVSASSTAFWLTLGLGALSAAALVVTAPWVSDFFEEPRLSPVIRVLSVQCLLAGICVVPAAILQRNLEFRKLFRVRLYSAAISGAGTIVLALNGFGYWSLVLGTLMSQASQTILLWLSVAWRPAMQYERATALSLFKFGKWAALSALLGWFYLWMDALIVGRYLGTHDMGIYRLGNTMVIALFGLILSPLLPVLFPMFSKHHGNLPAIRKDMKTVAKAIAVVSLPIGALLVSAAPIVESVMAPHNWSGIGSVIGFLGAAHGIAWLVGANGEALRGAGKPHTETLAMAIGTIGYLAAFLVAIQYGLEAFLWARLGLSCIGVGIQISAAKLALGLNYADWPALILKPALLAVLIVGVHFLGMYMGYSTLFSQVAILFTGIVAIAIFVYYSERELLQTALATLMNKPSTGKGTVK